MTIKSKIKLSNILMAAIPLTVTILYSNISDQDMEIAVKTAGDGLFKAKNLTASLDHASVLKTEPQYYFF